MFSMLVSNLAKNLVKSRADRDVGMPVFTGRRQNGKEYINQICINESFLEPKTWNLGGAM